MRRDLRIANEFDNGKIKDAVCIKCEHCVFDKWVPNHPLFKCLKNGEMDTATTETRSCPEKDS